MTPCFSSTLMQLALGELDAVEQRLHAGIRLVADLVVERLHGAVHVVGDREDVAREIRHAIDARIRDLALGAAAQILHLGERAQQPVLQVGRLLGERRHGIGGAASACGAVSGASGAPAVVSGGTGPSSFKSECRFRPGYQG